MPLLLGCGSSSFETERCGLSPGINLVAEFGCEFSDNAGLSGLRQQYEVVCPVCLHFAVSFLAHRCSVLSLSPIKGGLQQYGEG